jgi:hypothetical protein
MEHVNISGNPAGIVTFDDGDFREAPTFDNRQGVFIRELGSGPMNS